MNLRELLDTIIRSDEEDWHAIVCWGASSGPSYHDKLTFYEEYEGQSNVVARGIAFRYSRLYSKRRYFHGLGNRVQRELSSTLGEPIPRSNRFERFHRRVL